MPTKEQRAKMTPEQLEREREYCRAWNQNHKEYFRTWKVKNPEKVLESARAYKKRNREKCLAGLAAWHKKNRRAWVEFLKSKGFGRCLACGSDDFDNLHAHHVSRQSKEFEVGPFTARNSYSERTCDVLAVELDKCVCLCVLCHAKLHSRKKAEVEQAIQDRFAAMLALCLMHQPLSEEMKAA